MPMCAGTPYKYQSESAALEHEKKAKWHGCTKDTCLACKRWVNVLIGREYRKLQWPCRHTNGCCAQYTHDKACIAHELQGTGKC